jgi:hypothetical protein
LGAVDTPPETADETRDVPAIEAANLEVDQEHPEAAPDLSPPRIRRTTLRERLIFSASFTAATLGNLRRPGARLVSILILVFAAIQVAKWRDWPNAATWAWGSPWMILFLVFAGLSFIGRLWIVVDYRRLLTNQRVSPTLHAVAQAIATQVIRRGRFDLNDVSVSVWLVSGPFGLRWLARAAYVGEQRPVVPIVWLRGKGVIGHAWDEGVAVVADLDAARNAWPTESRFSRANPVERWHLSWAEFRFLHSVRAIVAIPLVVGRFGRHSVRGVLELSAFTENASEELYALVRSNEYREIIRVAVAVLSAKS